MQNLNVFKSLDFLKLLLAFLFHKMEKYTFISNMQTMVFAPLWRQMDGHSWGGLISLDSLGARNLKLVGPKLLRMGFSLRAWQKIQETTPNAR